MRESRVRDKFNKDFSDLKAFEKDSCLETLLQAYSDYYSKYRINDDLSPIKNYNQKAENIKPWISYGKKYIQNFQRYETQYIYNKVSTNGIAEFTKTIKANADREGGFDNMFLKGSMFGYINLFAQIFNVRVHILDKNKLKIFGVNEKFNIYMHITEADEFYILYPRDYKPNLLYSYIVKESTKIFRCARELCQPAQDEKSIIVAIKEFFLRSRCKKCKNNLYSVQKDVLRDEVKKLGILDRCIACDADLEIFFECENCEICYCNSKCINQYWGLKTRNCDICKRKLKGPTDRKNIENQPNNVSMDITEEPPPYNEHTARKPYESNIINARVSIQNSRNLTEQNLRPYNQEQEFKDDQSTHNPISMDVDKPSYLPAKKVMPYGRTRICERHDEKKEPVYTCKKCGKLIINHKILDELKCTKCNIFLDSRDNPCIMCNLLKFNR